MALGHQDDRWMMVVGVITLTLGLAFAVITWQAIRTPARIEPLVSSWEIEPIEQTVTWGEGDGIPTRGDFRCVDGYDPDAAIQFQAGIALESRGSVPTFVGPKVAASIVCNNGPTEFTIRWDSFPAGFELGEDAVASIRYSATPDGHTVATAQSEPFVLRAP